MLGSLLVGSQAPAAGVDPTAIVRTNGDAVADSSRPRSSYGASQLRVDGSPRVRTFVRFSVGALPGRISKAELLITAKSASTHPISAFLTSATWSERSLTHQNAPDRGAFVATGQPVEAGRTVAFDVTSAVLESGSVAFLLRTTSSTNVAL